MELCSDCGNKHPPLVTCSEAWRVLVQDLIMRIGRADKCPDPCGCWIYWIKQTNNKTVPYQSDGKIHLGICRGKYRKPK